MKPTTYRRYSKNGNLVTWCTTLFSLYNAGLVQFFGIDIDPVAVELARTSLKLYGLNSAYAKPALELSNAELDACPPPYNILYGDALAAHRRGDSARVQALTEEFNRNRAGSQPSVFSQPLSADR